MPLQYDDVPGSWGQAAENWPTYYAINEVWARRAYVACTKEYVLPYGSYVMDGLAIRCETPEMLIKLTEHMKTARVEDTDTIVKRVNDIENARSADPTVRRDFTTLVAASSLGTPEAVALRAQAPLALVDAVLARADELAKQADPAVRRDFTPAAFSSDSNCRACASCYLDDMDFICGHKDAGPLGLKVNLAAGPKGHCGPTRPKFVQHPLRTPDGGFIPPSDGISRDGQGH